MVPTLVDDEGTLARLVLVWYLFEADVALGVVALDDLGSWDDHSLVCLTFGRWYKLSTYGTLFEFGDNFVTASTRISVLTRACSLLLDVGVTCGSDGHKVGDHKLLLFQRCRFQLLHLLLLLLTSVSWCL